MRCTGSTAMAYTPQRAVFAWCRNEEGHKALEVLIGSGAHIMDPAASKMR